MVVKAIRKRQWFAYFPEDYRWSFNIAGALSRASIAGSAEVAEVADVCRRLANHVGDDKRWFSEWCKKAEEIRARAVVEERKKHLISAASLYKRASQYFLLADRFRFPKDKKALAMFKRGVDCFHRYARRIDRPRIEIVDIPFEGRKKLPAYFVHAENTRKARPPVVVLYTGFDGTKESSFFSAADAIVRRGMHCIAVDSPGVGEAIRFRGIYLRHDYEVAGSAVIDWLERRKDVDAKRVGIMAASLGGYYAPRSASMEPRFKACIAWGAQWDYYAIWKRRLDGVVQKMQCPFLLVHGEDDQQIPMKDARALFQAAGSKDKELKIFDGKEGGSQHCHLDYLSPAVDYMCDWIHEKLGA